MKTFLNSALILVLAFVAAGDYFESNASILTPVLVNEEGLTLVFEGVQTTVKCKTAAYLADEDPNGTNVRAKPDKNSAIIQTLKSEDQVVVVITGSNSGWFEISSAETAGGETDKTLFEGRGWIHSSVIGISIANGDPKLYAAPAKRSRVLKKLIPDSSPVNLLACRDDWMKVQSGKLTGWLSRDGQCANPLTTCS